MSHEVLITRRQSIFNLLPNPGRGGPQKACTGWCWLVLDAEVRLCLDLQKNKNALSSGYQDLMGHLILTLIHPDLNYTTEQLPYFLSSFSFDET